MRPILSNHMATDQFGNTFHELGPHPRKELMGRLGYSHASKMYVDLKTGGSRHTGWVIGPFWCSVFRVEPLHP